MTLRQSKNPLTGKVRIHGEQSQEHLIISLDIKGIVKKINPGRQNIQFQIILWRFTVTACKFAKTSPRTLAINELAVASRQRIVSQFLFYQGIFNKKQYDYHARPALIFSLSSVEDKSERPPF
jgi:hypothetical protein